MRERQNMIGDVAKSRRRKAPAAEVGLENAARIILRAMGREPETDAGIADTPRRFREWVTAQAAGRGGKISTTFAAERADQMVAVSGIRIYTLCEHHLLPFWVDLSVGYVTHGHLLGLSKLARIAHRCARGVQVQERLVEQVSAEVSRLARSPDVMVVGSGVHLCMVMRGVRERDAEMHTSVCMGAFRHNAAARAEFLELTRGRGGER